MLEIGTTSGINNCKKITEVANLLYRTHTAVSLRFAEKLIDVIMANTH